jgi:group II intron reverse transcriptase/maturase/CRISPR-associated endonuclease Cas1
MEQSIALLESAAHRETLAAAWKRIFAKGAAGGLDGVTVGDFADDAEGELERLRRDLLDQRYVPEPLREVTIPKGAGPERRVLGLPSIRDKIAQEAVRAVLEPLLNRRFLDCSYGYRPGKGPIRAIGRVTDYLVTRKRRWVAIADIDDFFGSLDQRLLLDRLQAALPDRSLLPLLELWLRMGAVDGRGRWRNVYSGVCQGGVISPLLANFYLHSFDEHLAGRGLGLVRYADDFVVLCAEQAEAEDALLAATSFLETALKLRLNPHPRPVVAAGDGFVFLGVQFHEGRRSMDPAKLDGMAARVARVAAAPDPHRALRELNQAVGGWRRYYGALLSPDALARLHGLVVDGLTRIIKSGIRHGAWRPGPDVEQTLAGVEMVLDLGTRDRSTLCAKIAADARRAPREPSSSAPPAPPALGSHKGETVAAALRRAKRRHLRHTAEISELVVNTPGCFLGKTSQRVVVRQDRRNVCEVPSFRLTGITVASRGISLSADLINHCAEHDIPVLFLSPAGKVAAVVSAPESSRGAVGLLQLQALADGGAALELARRFVEGKIRNQMSLMKYLGKYRARAHAAFAEAFPGALTGMAARLGELHALAFGGDAADGRGQLFSVEGRAAQEYWGLVRLLLADRAPFPGRERHGAKDLVNSLLNYGYAVLQARVHVALLHAGLAPHVSFLHTLQPKGQPTLVFDLMEEFRPHVVDRTVLTLFARREPMAVDETGLLTEATRRRLIQQIYDRLATVLRFHGKDVTLEDVIRHQATLLVRHLKGEARYRPFLAKW